jgi:hypothetical protein
MINVLKEEFGIWNKELTNKDSVAKLIRKMKRHIGKESLMSDLTPVLSEETLYFVGSFLCRFKELDRIYSTVQRPNMFKQVKVFVLGEMEPVNYQHKYFAALGRCLNDSDVCQFESLNRMLDPAYDETVYVLSKARVLKDQTVYVGRNGLTKKESEYNKEQSKKLDKKHSLLCERLIEYVILVCTNDAWRCIPFGDYYRDGKRLSELKIRGMFPNVMVYDDVFLSGLQDFVRGWFMQNSIMADFGRKDVSVPKEWSTTELKKRRNSADGGIMNDLQPQIKRCHLDVDGGMCLTQTTCESDETWSMPSIASQDQYHRVEDYHQYDLCFPDYGMAVDRCKLDFEPNVFENENFGKKESVLGEEEDDQVGDQDLFDLLIDL